MSKARWELSRAFNGFFGLHGDPNSSSFDDVLFEWVGHMGECPGIVEGFDRYIPPSLQAKREVSVSCLHMWDNTTCSIRPPLAFVAGFHFVPFLNGFNEMTFVCSEERKQRCRFVKSNVV